MTKQTAPRASQATIGARARSLFPVEPLEPVGFPGRWVGAAGMMLGPVLMLVGALLRVEVPFFFPEQLAGYAREPVLMATAYGFFATGSVLLWPAVALLAARISDRSPGWAVWGGTLATFGLFARAFHAGTDHMAFRLVDAHGPVAATETVASGYAAFHIFSVLNVAILVGWIVLAVGAWLTGVLGPVRSLALGSMAALPIGVLKGTTPMSLVALTGLCIALVPMGVGLLRDFPRPATGAVVRWSLVTMVTLGLLTLLGQAG
ncbi:hypothetical protein FB381_4525 [Nocardioides albertanoniae]|uniref:Uncharacterized protein n=1 Tax=Nocardioides albertanoniae TaxID=1175486 RepID=A0A543ADK8_9ACTN|nr:hypothetical protein [Nocardioides albertanoniae]TQL70586.1 hypothetical protein FB381_4525 [Nocardioides albertanoniae]